jgi:antirestriction protein ArdC
VPPGEWGVRAILVKPVAKAKKNPNGADEEDKFLVLRQFVLFNCEQCNGPGIEQYHARPRTEGSFVNCERAERVIFGTPADIRHGGVRAVYYPVQDYIDLPPRTAFRQAPEYYGTAAHELVHWSGHEKRLARLNKLARFGDEAYAMEELVAEMGAAFLTAEIGIPDAGDLSNVTAYLASWLKVLENDHSAIITASAAASRAVDFILSFTEAQRVAEEEEIAAT